MSKYFIKKLIRAFLCLWCCILCFIPNVHARTFGSCFDKYKFENIESPVVNDEHFIINNTDLSKNHPLKYDAATNSWIETTTTMSGIMGSLSYNKLFEVEIGKNYYITSSSDDIFENRNQFIHYNMYLDNFHITSTLGAIKRTEKRYGSFPENLEDNYIILRVPDSVEDPNLSGTKYVSIDFYYNKESFYKSDLYFTDFNLYEASCPSDEPDNPITPDNPDEPEKPSITESDELSIFSNFFDLFIDRLKFISNFATSSPIFLGFVSILILFIVLEFILYLFNKGGYK